MSIEIIGRYVIMPGILFWAIVGLAYSFSGSPAPIEKASESLLLSILLAGIVLLMFLFPVLLLY